MRRVLFAVLGLAGLLIAGCSSAVAGVALPAASPEDDRELVREYFDELNAAGEEGADVQGDFLRHSQHPDYTDELCDMGGLTINVDPAMSTMRVDPDWVPPDAGRDAEHPRGLVYVLGVSVSIRQDGALLGEQIGSQRVVVLDDRAYGFAPCPTG